MIKMVISARRTWEANPRTNVETSVWRHWWLFDRLWPIDHAWLWILYDDDDQKNVGDKSKHNAPDWESSKWRFSTLVDPVEDEHLVQIEDHPERDINERGNLGRDEGFHPRILNLGRLHIRKVVTMAMSTRVSLSSRPRRRRRCRTW